MSFKLIIPVIQTYSGILFFPFDPKPEMIDIRDIAHALSLKVRFNGHVKDFYSIAEHSLFVSKHCDPNDALWGLLHDAADAYLPDVAMPMKPCIDGFYQMENRVLRCIIEKFGLTWPKPASVKLADNIATVTEARDFMRGSSSYLWNYRKRFVSPDPASLWSDVWWDVEVSFLTRFTELTGTEVSPFDLRVELCEWCGAAVNDGNTHGQDQCFRFDDEGTGYTDHLDLSDPANHPIPVHHSNQNRDPIT